VCGFAGDVRFDGSSADQAAVARMTDRMASRGPDGDGAWADGRTALGHRRLAIIDPSDAGAQPMVDDELDLAVVFNGCIYNHAELREELGRTGHRFRSTVPGRRTLLQGVRRLPPATVRVVGARVGLP
jgi:asparagine synthase (glutamine-hydrolysing)